MSANQIERRWREVESQLQAKPERRLVDSHVITATFVEGNAKGVIDTNAKRNVCVLTTYGN